jgi:serine/threonine protein phosphatase PrpC
MTEAAAFRWTSASRTDVGNARQINEDALLDLPGRGLWVVADGMGGHAAGDVASQMVVGKLDGIDSHDKLSEFVDDVEDRVLEVNRRLYEMSHQEEPPRVIGSTLAALLVHVSYAICMWAGDSRVYRLRSGALRQLTRDHSEIEELIAKGELDEESALDHPAANVVTRAVGGLEHLYVDVRLYTVRDGDRFLLCSDGLFKDLSEEEIAHLVAEGSCVEACDALIETVLSREAADNVTVIIVEFAETSAD